LAGWLAFWLDGRLAGWLACYQILIIICYIVLILRKQKVSVSQQIHRCLCLEGNRH
jgi:hypothetical protein